MMSAKDIPTANPSRYPQGTYVANPELDAWLDRQKARDDLLRKCKAVVAAYDKASGILGRRVTKEEAYGRGWDSGNGGWGTFLKWRKCARELGELPEEYDPTARNRR